MRDIRSSCAREMPPKQGPAAALNASRHCPSRSVILTSCGTPPSECRTSNPASCCLHAVADDRAGNFRGGRQRNRLAATWTNVSVFGTHGTIPNRLLSGHSDSTSATNSSSIAMLCWEDNCCRQASIHGPSPAVISSSVSEASARVTPVSGGKTSESVVPALPLLLASTSSMARSCDDEAS